MKDRVTLIGCPKLDDVDYTEKLTQIFSENDIKSVTVVRMEVPCCGGLQMAAQKALPDGFWCGVHHAAGEVQVFHCGDVYQVLNQSVMKHAVFVRNAVFILISFKIIKSRITLL